ncbi:MAG: gliding motility-associated C-terminal domain-containing protein, partial [Cytophagaceae bacterium]
MLFLLAFHTLFFHVGLRAEGTRELRPTQADHGYMQIHDVVAGVARPFMSYDAPEESRLNIRICNVGERIYMGFRTMDNNVAIFFRVKDPNGNLVTLPGMVEVVGVPNTYEVPRPVNSDNNTRGFIGNYNRAVEGPRQIVGGGDGYLAIEYISTMVGDYSIEFNPNNPVTLVQAKRLFREFDITVASPANEPILGRLWSMNWDITLNAQNNRFNATFFIYAKDSIITSVNFNGMRPWGFTISANSTGLFDSGDREADRISRIGNFSRPEYMLFLNEPDPGCFPNGEFGTLTEPTTITGCDPNNRCINIYADKVGDVEILLDLNGIEGFQPDTRDRVILGSVVPGHNCITWDSQDGFGDYLPPGNNVQLEVNYYNGLTHLPLYDVEFHEGGYVVQLVRPNAGVQPLLFWDDRPITAGYEIDGLFNLTGCDSEATGGCHRFGNRGHNNCNPTCPETINTWWYANVVRDVAEYDIPDIYVNANTNNPPGTRHDTTVCANTPPIQLNGGVTGGLTSTGVWSGAGTFVGGNTLLNAQYIPTAGEIAAGTTYVVLTSTENQECPEQRDTMWINITPLPALDAGPPQTVCYSSPEVTLSGSRENVLRAWWSGGNGIFAPHDSLMTALYEPSAGEISAGTVRLYLNSETDGICPAPIDSVDITILPPAVVDAGADQTVCGNNATVNLSGSIEHAEDAVWSNGNGFTSTSLDISYTPTEAEITAGLARLTLTSANYCLDVSDTVDIIITPAPTVDAGPDLTICSNGTAELVGAFTNAEGVVWSGGQGNYAPKADTTHIFYTPHADELSGNIVMTLTTTVEGNCLPVSDDMTIFIDQGPSADAGPNNFVCSNNPRINLNGSVELATGGQWLGQGGSFNPDAFTLSTTYFPTVSEIQGGLVALVLSTTGNGNCPPATDEVFFVVQDPPAVDAGPDQTVCANNAVVQLSGTVTPTAPVLWTSLSGDEGAFQPSPTVVNPTYTPSASEIAAGEVRLVLRATRTSCLPVRDTLVVTITPIPVANAGQDRSVCYNNPVITLAGSVSYAGGGEWIGGMGNFNPDRNSLTAIYTLSNAEVSQGFVELTLRTTDNGECLAETDVVRINVTPAPTVDAGDVDPVCGNNATIQLGGTVTGAGGGEWVGGTGTFSPGRTSLNATYVPSTAEITAGFVNLSLHSTNNGTCNAVIDDVMIDITPAPTVNPGSGQTICGVSGTSVTLNGSMTVAGGVIWSGGTGLFSPNPPTNQTVQYSPSVAEINSGTAVLTLTTTGNGICNAVSGQVTITIRRPPSLSAGPDQSVCADGSSVINTHAEMQHASGVTWTSSGTGSFSNANNINTSYTLTDADKLSGAVTLTVQTLSDGVCPVATDELRIDISPVPVINAGPDRIVCTTEFPAQLNATGTPANWVGGGGTFNPGRNVLNPEYTPSAGEVAAGEVTLTITTIPSGSCPSVSDELRITIPQGPQANAGPDETVCASAGDVPLNGSVNNATGGFWSTSGTGEFIPNQTTLNASYRMSATDTASGTVVLTLTSMGNDLCVPASSNKTLTIVPEIYVFAGPDQTICADADEILLNGQIANSTINSWSVVSGSGTFASATSLSTSYTLTESDKTSGTVTLRLTANGTIGCPPVSDDVTFTILPGPVADAGDDLTICVDEDEVPLEGTVTNALGGIWSTSGSGEFIPDPSQLSLVYEPSQADKDAGSVTLTLTTEGNGICNAVADDLILTIAPGPTAMAGPDREICANGSVELNGVVTVAGGGTWSSSGNGTFTPDADALDAVYTPSAQDLDNGIVTLTLETTDNGTCNAVEDQLVITFAPVPEVNAGPDRSLCADIEYIQVNGVVENTVGGGVWTSSGTGNFQNANMLSTRYYPSSADRSSPDPLVLRLS